MKFPKKAAYTTLAVLFWVAVWGIAAHVVGKPLLFPSPVSVLSTLCSLLQTKAFYTATIHSLWNVTAGIVAAMVLGSILAMLTCKIPLLRSLLLPLMSVIKATPVASFIILALIWLGSSRVPSFITFLIVLPVLWTNLDVGLNKIDAQLREVALVYRMPFFKRLRLLLLPSVKPYFISACRTSVGLAWKAGIAAEIIAMPKNTIGTMLGEAKLYILTSEMFAWTVTVILLSLLVEFCFSKLFQKAQTKEEWTEHAEH